MNAINPPPPVLAPASAAISDSAHSAGGGSNVQTRPAPLVPTGVLGAVLFVFTEVMLFSGFISAFLIARSNAVPGNWPPPDQPMLPATTTAFNTIALLLSGIALFVGARSITAKQPATKANVMRLKRYLGLSILLGGLYVGLQGIEWMQLLAHGLTLWSSQLGAFFYLIIGAHALHAALALALLIRAWWQAKSGTLTAGTLWATEVFWYFVVGVWPFLYWRVYL